MSSPSTHLNTLTLHFLAFKSSHSLDSYRGTLPTYTKKYLRSILNPRVSERDSLYSDLIKCPSLVKYRERKCNGERLSGCNDEDDVESREILSLLGVYFKILKASYQDYNEDKEKYLLAGETLMEFEAGLGTRVALDMELYIGVLESFGADKYKHWLERIFKLEDWGCFALTELAHGSNARALQTTCTFISKSDGFLLNTPNEAAIKFWIGSGYKLANMAIVFARLLVPEQDVQDGNSELLQDYGIHPFLVQLRKHPGGGLLLPGIEIGTCGAKIGYKTAENGWFKFNKVVVPYKNWLNHNLDIENIKEEKSKRVVVERTEQPATNVTQKIFPPSLPPLIDEQKEIKTVVVRRWMTPEHRFAIRLGHLLNKSRLLICLRAAKAFQKGVAFAIRFVALRRQFKGTSKNKEIALIEYPLIQSRLMRRIADSIVISLIGRRMVDSWKETERRKEEREGEEGLKNEKLKKREEEEEEEHATICIMKAICTTICRKGLEECREICGSFGFSEYTDLGRLYNDCDVNVTWLGDSNVLLLQGERFLAKVAKMNENGEKINFENLKFLSGRNIEKEKSGIRSEKEIRSLEEISRALQYRVLVHLNPKKKEAGKSLFDIFDFREATLAFGALILFIEGRKRLISIKDKQSFKVLKQSLQLQALYSLLSTLPSFITYYTPVQLAFLKDSIKALEGKLSSKSVDLGDALGGGEEIEERRGEDGRREDGRRDEGRREEGGGRREEGGRKEGGGKREGKVYEGFLHKVMEEKGCFSKVNWWTEIYYGE